MTGSAGRAGRFSTIKKKQSPKRGGVGESGAGLDSEWYLADDGKRLGHARNVALIPFVMGERSENMEGVGSEGGGWSGLTP